MCLFCVIKLFSSLLYNTSQTIQDVRLLWENGAIEKSDYNEILVQIENQKRMYKVMCKECSDRREYLAKERELLLNMGADFASTIDAVVE